MDARLSEEQTKAVENAVKERVSIITGPPGSGKTFVITEIVKRWSSSSLPTILLLAPTGVAADVLNSRVASTLRYDNVMVSTVDMVVCNPPTKLAEAYCVVVDECSMLTPMKLSDLMDALGGKKKKKNNKYLFVGDAFQLGPSDGTTKNNEMTMFDTWLRYLPRSVRERKITELTKSFRLQTRENSALHRNVCYFSSVTDSSNLATDNTSFMILYSDEISSMKFPPKREEIDGLVDRLSDCFETLADFEGCQILTHVNATRTTVNEKMQRKMNEHSHEIKPGIRLYDPVVCTSNHYRRRIEKEDEEKRELCVANGTKGKIVADGFSHFRIAYTNGFVDEPDSYGKFASECELAYAVTIDKSQGNEYDTVIVMCDTFERCIPNRRAFYTAISRAKKTCILVGTRRRVDFALQSFERLPSAYSKEFEKTIVS